MKRSSTIGMAEGARIRSRAIGSLFFSAFGFAWMCCGLQATHHASAKSLGGLFAMVVALLALCAILLRRARTLPAGDAMSEFAIRARRMFLAVNIIQWVSIVTAAAILLLLHIPEYAAPAIAIIVGLNLFPLAGSFRNRLHYVTGGLLLMWSLACLALLPREQMMGIPALGVGVILLASAAGALLMNFGTSRSPIDGIPAERAA